MPRSVERSVIFEIVESNFHAIRTQLIGAIHRYAASDLQIFASVGWRRSTIVDPVHERQKEYVICPATLLEHVHGSL